MIYIETHMTNIAIFASGSGTNAENLVKAFSDADDVKFSLMVSNRTDSGVHGRMSALGIPSVTLPNSVWADSPQEVIDLLKQKEIDFIVLAGFLRKLDSLIIQNFKGRIINIHPSILPKYGGKGMYGMRVHEAVVAAGEKESGATVHHVTDEMDEGEIIMQMTTALDNGETPQSLADKIHDLEMELYPKALAKVLGIQMQVQNASLL